MKDFFYNYSYEQRSNVTVYEYVFNNFLNKGYTFAIIKCFVPIKICHLFLLY